MNPCIFDRQDLALNTSQAETARNDDPVEIMQILFDVLRRNFLRIDPADVDFASVGDPAML